MTNENYITIQGWMINELKLSGNELICYAIIYGFSQDGETEFSGSRSYLADALNISKQSVSSILKSLVDKEIIIKNDIYVNGVKFCKYRAVKTIPVVKKLDRGSQETCPGGSQETCPNNTILHNTINTIEYNSSEKFDFSKSLTAIGVDEELAKEFTAFRKKRKASNTLRAFNTLQKEIGKTGISANECIEKALMRGWQGFEAAWITNGKQNNYGKKNELGTNSGGQAGCDGGANYSEFKIMSNEELEAIGFGAPQQKQTKTYDSF